MGSFSFWNGELHGQLQSSPESICVEFTRVFGELRVRYKSAHISVQAGVRRYIRSLIATCFTPEVTMLPS